jgi:hypothetical protein
MIPVLLGLLSGAGAWMAWRRNPLYSTRSALRSTAFVLLAIAAIISLNVAVVNLTLHRSPNVALISIGVAVVLSTISLIFIIQAVSTPKEAKLGLDLPPSAKVVHIHRQRIYQWTKLLVILLVLCANLAFLLPGIYGELMWVPGSVAVLLGLFGLLPLYFKAWGLDRAVTAVMYNPWVHWQYPAEEWRHWAEVRGERAKASLPKISSKRERIVSIIISAGIAIGVLIFLPAPSMLLRTLCALGLGGGTYGFFAWKEWNDAASPENARSTVLKAKPEVYIGHDGLFCDGAFTTWLSVSVYLTSAAIDERQPRSLSFRFEKYVGTNPYGGNLGSGSVALERNVLIPTGGGGDIERLQRELTARCPKARIGLS